MNVKTLFFGAGPLGLLYAHRLHDAGADVTVLARGAPLERIHARSLSLVDGFTEERVVPELAAIEQLSEDERYDLVSLRHVLEHLVDPRLALTRIGARLNSGGYALFEMPNIEALDKKLKRALVNAGWHRRRFPADFLPGHCNEYGRRSFEYLLRETGFELVRWETYSMKAFANFIYTRVPIGNKARALVRKL